MFQKTFPVLLILLSLVATSAQTNTYYSPKKIIHALIIPVGGKGYETHESRIEIRCSSGFLLQRKSFASRDHDHGEGVGHAEWTTDGRFFVFNTFSSGGHQPWHVSTYVYSVRANNFYVVDSFVGPITSDFKLRGSTLLTTRMGTTADENMSVIIRLARLR